MVDQFAARVKKLRLFLKMSREELANAVGVTASTVYRWEKQKGFPSKAGMHLVCDFLKTRQWGERRIYYELPDKNLPSELQSPGTEIRQEDSEWQRPSYSKRLVKN